jgi:acyl-CoA thioesterase-1
MKLIALRSAILGCLALLAGSAFAVAPADAATVVALGASNTYLWQGCGA